MFTKAAHTAPKMRYAQRRVFGWRPSLLTWFVVLFLLAGTAVIFHTTIATWFSKANQAAFITQYLAEINRADYDPQDHIEDIATRNTSGAQDPGLNPFVRYPVGSEISHVSELTEDPDAAHSAALGRLQIPDIEVDLPIFEGTDEATLTRGAGHLANSDLPVGGESNNAVLTAYRGLPTATMFNRLNELTPGDRIRLSTFGEVLSYTVKEVQQVPAEERFDLRSQTDNDQLTLVTSSPLSEDAPRIVVIAERLVPTSAADQAAALEQPSGPGFPQWAIFLLIAYAAIGLYLWRAGYTDARQRRIRQAQHRDQKRQDRRTST